MKEVFEKKFITITASDEREFDAKVNETIKKYKIDSIGDIEIEHGRNDFRAYIMATRTVMVPETVAERLNELGEHLHCKDCPQFSPQKNMDGSEDRRAKHGECVLRGISTRCDSEACEFRYKQFVKEKDICL